MSPGPEDFVESSSDNIVEEEEVDLRTQEEICECIGYDALPNDFFVDNGYGDGYGSSCLNWDADKSWCVDDGQGLPEWCEPDYSWCYVEPACIESLETVYFVDTEYEG